ncbi:uncharacterized protein LDX57_010709 [Aspergillus melleus]|uniref:uncharacterized protein n=1 Tax=Aspergillus melleus TaxID=138277 RepID=UPI001E8D481C|nr:uncharacterized protein LDX57_010709 [Aspergillus melleus]KAH8433072.1 hypothetical protein LDX57_010709 [Aspergillus melleus]
MSNRYEREAEDRYEQENDPSPVGGAVYDNSYAHETTRQERDRIPVQRDDEDFEDPMQPPYSNSNQQLDEDESEVINDSNNMQTGSRLRHAKPQTRNAYNEGPGEDDLPAEAY